MNPDTRTPDGQSILDDRLADLVLEGLRELARGRQEPGHESATRVSLLVSLTLLLERWARGMNLSGHRDPERIVRRLVLDAAALHAKLNSLDPGSVRCVADLGAGAGFPGLPLAILEPDWHVVLVESRRRRHHFQRAARRDLALENVEPLLGRIEALEARPSEIVIAQALAAPHEALRRMIAWSRPGGLLLIPGGEAGPDPGLHAEIEASGVVDYRVPLGGPARTLWWGRRRVS